MSQKSSVGIKILEIDHIVIRCKDVERQLKFYVDILGLEPYRIEEFARRQSILSQCQSS